MRRLVFLAALAAALTAPLPAVAAVTDGPPSWRAASDVRKQLAKAEETLIIDGPRAASAWVAQAQKSYANGLELEFAAGAPAAARTVRLGLSKASRAVADGDVIALEAARAGVSTAIVLGSYRIVLDRIAAGDSRAARQWLLVREFRAPTRFSRPGADATLAVKLLVEGKTTPREAAAIVRADLLDTYQERLRVALTQGDDASSAGFDAKRAGAASLAAGYFDILSGAYEEQRGTVETRQAEAAFAALAASALAGDDAGYAAARAEVDGSARPIPGGTALARGAEAPRRSVRAIPRSRTGRVWTRRVEREGDQGLRDPGGGQLPGRGRRSAQRPGVCTRRARCGEDSGDHEARRLTWGSPDCREPWR